MTSPVLSQRSGLSRRAGIMEARRAARAEREIELQEMENNRIHKINQRIDVVRARIDEIRGLMHSTPEELMYLEKRSISHDDLRQELESRFNMIESLAGKIAQIYEKRAEREAARAEQNARELQMKMEERLREREEEAKEAAENMRTQPREAEEIEQQNERAKLQNFAHINQSSHVIHELARVRGARSLEALQLRHAIQSENSWGFKIITEDIKIKVPSGRENPNDFRNYHLRKVETGIARMDEAIMQRVVDMYRRSKEEAEAAEEE